MPIIGRALLSALFIYAGIGKILTFAATSAYISTVLPLSDILTVLVIITELGGGLMLLLGYKARLAACVLAIFTVLATVLFHNDLSVPMQDVMVLKNVAIIGGLLYVSVYGARRFAIEKCPAPTHDASSSS
jgi:putative oxidoreductase